MNILAAYPPACLFVSLLSLFFIVTVVVFVSFHCMRVHMFISSCSSCYFLFTILWAYLADDKLMIFLSIFTYKHRI